MVCLTELLFNDEFFDPEEIDNLCRENDQKTAFISCQVFGPWGYIFSDYGKEHIVTDGNGEPVKTYLVNEIIKGENTKILLFPD